MGKSKKDSLGDRMKDYLIFFLLSIFLTSCYLISPNIERLEAEKIAVKHSIDSLIEAELRVSVRQNPPVPVDTMYVRLMNNSWYNYLKNKEKVISDSIELLKNL